MNVKKPDKQLIQVY